MKKYLEKTIYYLILTIVILLPFFKLTSYNLFFLNLINDPFNFSHVYLLWIVLFLLLLIYIYGVITKKIKINYIDYIFYILILTALLSTIFAVNIKLSIFGEFHRNEGLLSILSYYFIFLCTKSIDNEKYKNNIINMILIVGVFQVIYAILQVFTDLSFIKHYTEHYMASSLCGNPNFFGSYILMLLTISINKFLLEKKYKYLLLSIIYFVGLVLASSLGPFITFILILIFMVILSFKYTRIKYILYLLVLIPIFFLTNYSIKNTNKNEIVNENIASDITSITNKSIDEISNNRLTIWKNSIPLIKKYYIVGAGLDNFGEVYEYNTGLIRFDKAHNVYLQILVTNGIIPFILTIILCIICFIKGFKIKNIIYYPIYFSCIAYMIQAFANISVIDVAPIFYILFGIMLNNKSI